MKCGFCDEELEVSVSGLKAVCVCPACGAAWAYGMYLLSCTAPTRKEQPSLIEVVEKYLGPLPELP